MINAERFKKEIRAMTDESTTFAFKADDPTVIRKCNELGCHECLFNCGKCFLERTRWIISEYKESTKVTRLEYELLKYWNGKRYKYIARDRDGALSIYIDKPSKNEDVWGTLYRHARLMKCFDDLFCFVKWEDKEPIEIKEVLENCKAFDDD